MSIRLYYSHRTEDLAEKLSANLKSESEGADPFVKSTIIIPNKNIEQWLRMDIARRNSISTNIDFPFLEKGLWNALSAVDPEKEKPRILTEGAAQLLVVSELLDLDVKDKDLSPLGGYLYLRGRSRPPDYYRKVWQLSEKLGRCFREYEYNRQELIAAWLSGKLYYAGGSANLKAMERCQRSLYVNIFAPGGSCEKLSGSKGGRLMTLPQYERAVFHSRRKPPSKKMEGPSIHIFGLSQISGFHTRLLFEIGRLFDVKIYQINVCSEFWEDVSTPQEDIYRRFKALEIKEDMAGEYLEEKRDDNRLLKLWGKPGRENVKLLSDLEEACSGRVEFDADWILPAKRGPGEEKTVLNAVQDHILQRKGSGRKISQDRSVQIAGCPGIYRETEAVYNSIIKNMSSDPGLRLTDIAVLVSSIHEYAPAIKAVFSRSPQNVPFNLSDIAAPEESIYAQAVSSLLDIVEGPFSRQNVFSLFLNDCFLARMRLSREDALTWLRWADRLNIFHSFDEEDKMRRSYTADLAYTWKQGLLRLRLARIMDTAEAPGPSGKFPEYKGIVPFSDTESENAGLVSHFSMAVETLAVTVKDLSGKEMSCRDWAEAVRMLADRFIAVPYGRDEEERLERKMKNALEDLEGFDAILAGPGPKKVGFGFVSEYINSYLSKVTASHGKYLAGGVTISSLLPMRPIPFRIVYVMGLGEGSFPGAPDRSTLDLRHYKRRIGDISVDEANRYLFLETLLSARDKLYLTYVSRDTRKDEVLYPCSVVNELRGYLDDSILKSKFKTLNDEFPGWPDDIPLKGSSDKYLTDPKAIPEWSDILVNYSVPDRIACLVAADISGRPPLSSGAKKELGGRSKAYIKWARVRSGVDLPERRLFKPAEKITVKELADFLKNPADGAFKRHLGLYDDEEGDLAVFDDEPFRSAHPLDYLLTAGLAGDFIDDWQNLGPARRDPAGFLKNKLENLYEHYRLRGSTPGDVFGEVDKKRFEEALKERVLGARGLESFLSMRSSRKYHRAIAMGNLGVTAPADLRYGPLKIPVRMAGGTDAEVELHGELPFVWIDEASGSYETVIMKKAGPVAADPLSGAILKPAIFFTALTASGVPAGRCAALTIHIASDKGVERSWRFSVSRDEARRYLAGIAGEFLGGKVFDLLPIEIVKKFLPFLSGGSKPSREDMDGYRSRLQEEMESASGNRYSVYSPGPLLKAANLKIPEDAYMKSVRRIKWLMERFDA